MEHSIVVNKQDALTALVKFNDLYECDLRGLPPETVVLVSSAGTITAGDVARLASLYRQVSTPKK